MVNLIQEGYFQKKTQNTATTVAGAAASTISADSTATATSADSTQEAAEQQQPRPPFMTLSEREKSMALFPQGCWFRMPAPTEQQEKPWPVLQVSVLQVIVY